MKTPQCFLLVLVLALGVLSNSCDSSTSVQQSACGDPNLHERKRSFILGDELIDFDSLKAFSYHIYTSWDWLKSAFTIEFGTWGGSPDVELTLKFSKYESGVYFWEDRTRDSTDYGCQLRIDSLGHSITYRSISGVTNLRVYDSPDREPDSIFATFCGKVKDDNGNIFEVSDGKFYYVYPE